MACLITRILLGVLKCLVLQMRWEFDDNSYITFFFFGETVLMRSQTCFYAEMLKNIPKRSVLVPLIRCPDALMINWLKISHCYYRSSQSCVNMIFLSKLRQHTVCIFIAPKKLKEKNWQDILTLWNKHWNDGSARHRNITETHCHTCGRLVIYMYLSYSWKFTTSIQILLIDFESIVIYTAQNI